jgi:hypothetical protein
MRMEAQTEALSGAGSRQSGIADNIAELSSRLTAAADAASGAGEPALQEAMTGAVQSWQASLALVSESVHGLGANLVAASHIYAYVDETAIPAG